LQNGLEKLAAIYETKSSHHAKLLDWEPHLPEILRYANYPLIKRGKAKSSVLMT